MGKVDLGLRGRNALVGGASAGLGRASAERLAAEGCRLVLWSRGGDALERAADEIRHNYSTEVATVAADATDPSAAEQVGQAALAAFGKIDIAVLNAGGPPTSTATNTDPDEWRRAFQLLAVTPIELATRLLPGMRERKWGRIVSIMSSGIRAPIQELVYSGACRSALAVFLKTISIEVMADGVTVNGVMPGRLATDRVATLDHLRAERSGRTPEEIRAELERGIPAGRYGQPDELAAYVAWLCSDLARYQTGTFVPIDGGSFRAIP
jgi:3-oxoacyl-[acyl-carrier protein] reductase